MDVITVYRYENAHGEGPYIGRQHPLQNKLHTDHGWTSTGHPSARYDTKQKMTSADVCACPTRELLSHWFLGFEAGLQANGFRVVAYQVPTDRVLMGTSGLQCVFNRDDAIRVDA